MWQTLKKWSPPPARDRKSLSNSVTVSVLSTMPLCPYILQDHTPLQPFYPSHLPGSKSDDLNCVSIRALLDLLDKLCQLWVRPTAVVDLSPQPKRGGERYTAREDRVRNRTGRVRIKRVTMYSHGLCYLSNILLFNFFFSVWSAYLLQ